MWPVDDKLAGLFYLSYSQFVILNCCRFEKALDASIFAMTVSRSNWVSFATRVLYVSGVPYKISRSKAAFKGRTSRLILCV